MPAIDLSRSHYPVSVLGPGKRVGIWVQGCTLACDGCISRDTWDADGGQRVSIVDLADWCLGCISEGAEGITISGGEPFQQADALGMLLDRLREAGLPDGFDVLAYSGYTLKYLRRHHSALLKRIDAVVSEPYIADRGEGGWLRGSANQSITPLSDLGVELYGAGRANDKASPSIQLSVDRDTVWYIGIPRQGDMQRLEHFAREKGIKLEGATWLS